MKPLKIGQRVRIKSLDAKGEVFHIDHANYFQHHMMPIQVILDKPLEDDSYQMKGANWYRTGVDDIVTLKKKKKPQKEEVFLDFSF